MSEVENLTEIEGIYTLSDIDKATFYRIENSKSTYMLNLTDLTVSDARDKLADLFSTMLGMLEKYFKTPERNHVTEQKVKIDGADYNFYDLNSLIPVIEDKPIIRKIAEEGFSIYNHFIKILGVAVPTTRKDPNFL